MGPLLLWLFEASIFSTMYRCLKFPFLFNHHPSHLSHFYHFYSKLKEENFIWTCFLSYLWKMRTQYHLILFDLTMTLLPSEASYYICSYRTQGLRIQWHKYMVTNSKLSLLLWGLWDWREMMGGRAGALKCLFLTAATDNSIYETSAVTGLPDPSVTQKGAESI